LYILEGEITAQVGEARVVLRPGDYAFGPRGVPHGYRVTGSGPARLLMMTGDRDFAEFVREISEPAASDDLPPPSETSSRGLVIGALQSRLMDPALCAEFCEEYIRQRNALHGARNAQLSGARVEHAKLARDRERLIQAIKDGVPAAEVKDDLARIAARRDELEALLESNQVEPVLLHPGMAEHYRRQVAALAEALNADANRAEAADILRGLIDRIVLTPNAEGKLEIDLFGDLAGILGLAANKNGPLDASDPSIQQVKLVAGAGYQRQLLVEAWA
jgi:Cupin domain